MSKINIFAKYGSDVNKEVHGAKFYIDEDADAYILVGRWCGRNVEHAKAQAELTKQFGTESTLESEELRSKVFVKHLVKGWNNVTDDSGETIEFSTEKAVEILTQLPDLVSELVAFSLTRENYPIDKTEEVVKN